MESAPDKPSASASDTTPSTAAANTAAITNSATPAKALPRGRIDAGRLAELKARARREVDEGILPSCQLAVARAGELAMFETFGKAAPASRYTIFSVTKAIVAGAAWQLIGEGKLDPAQPVAELIGEFATNGKHVVTLEHLLTHTAGFPSAPLGPPDWFDRAARLARFASWRLNWEPGTRSEYHASSAHWVLAELIERAAGRDYRAFVNAEIAAALGLAALRLGVPEVEQGDINTIVAVGSPTGPEELAAAGFPAVELPEVTDAALLRFNEPETRALGVPGGGAVSTAADVALYFQALLHNPGRLWNPTVLADATAVIRTTLVDWTTGGVPANRSLGLIIAGDDGYAVRRSMGRTCSPRTFGHPGAGGQIAWADPESGVSFCYLTDGLDANILREGRRGASLSNRAGALCS
jgi:CubicO group peptidase (beta-lactamase class C family)